MEADAAREALSTSGRLVLEATERGDVQRVATLLQDGADLCVTDGNAYTALILGARYAYADIVRLLLREGADVHSAHRGARALLLTAEYRTWADMTVVLLLAAGTPCCDTDPVGPAALMLASTSRDVIARINDDL
jgi:ankyrin repeat protein